MVSFVPDHFVWLLDYSGNLSFKNIHCFSALSFTFFEKKTEVLGKIARNWLSKGEKLSHLYPEELNKRIANPQAVWI